MRSLPILALSLAAVVVVAACSSGSAASPVPPASPAAASPAPAAPTTADLDGNTYIVTGVQGHDLVEGSEVSLRFDAGSLGISAGCNQMGGAYTVTDGVLTVGPMMTTEMACEEPLMAQDQWISTFVSGAAITLEGDTLTLAKDGVIVTATDREVAKPDLPVEGTVWTVEGLVSNQAVSSMPAGVEASLVFADGKVAVDAGCNKGSGAAEIGDTTITFGPIATTKMFCEGAAGEVEQQVLGVLTGEVAYTVDADVLQLRGAGGGLDLRARP
jgi:heat shock protein HslJ